MINKKFFTRLLNAEYRKKTMMKNHKFINDEKLKVKQYATYVVDKHCKDRNMDVKDSKEAKYGLCPIDVIAYCANDGTVKKSLFEFNSINHFLVKDEHSNAVEVAICIISELAKENKKDVCCFDIDKIDADMKRCEEDYLKMVEEMKKMKDKNGNNSEEVHKEANS